MTDSFQRELALPIDLDALWRAVSESDALGTWLADEVVWQLTPGGEASFIVDGEPRTGWVEEVSPPEDGKASLAFWWQAEDGAAARVALTLSETAAGTRLKVCESRPLEILDVIGLPVGSDDERRGPVMVGA